MAKSFTGDAIGVELVRWMGIPAGEFPDVAVVRTETGTYISSEPPSYVADRPGHRRVVVELPPHLQRFVFFVSDWIGKAVKPGEELILELIV